MSRVGGASRLKMIASIALPMSNDNPLNDPRAEELDKHSSCPKVVTGKNHDLAISIRPHENGFDIADKVDGLKYEGSIILPMGELGEFSFKDD